MDESKEKSLQKALNIIEEELDEILSNTECAMAVLSANQAKVPVLVHQIQEMKKLLEPNDVSQIQTENPPADTENQPATSSQADQFNLTPNASIYRSFMQNNIRTGSNFIGGPAAKRMKPTTTEDSVSSLPDSPLEEIVPPEVQKAIELSKGILNPLELYSFLYLSRDVDHPVQLAKVSFTTDINLLYCQLLSLKFNFWKICGDISEKPSDLISFRERLDLLIGLFQSTVHGS